MDDVCCPCVKEKMRSARETHGAQHVSKNRNKRKVRRKNCHAAVSCIVPVGREMKREE